MLTIIISVFATLAEVGLVAAAFWLGLRFERRRRERFDLLIEQATADAAARLDAAIAGQSEQVGQPQPSVH